MGENHCWHFFRRTLCAAIAIAVATITHCMPLALAAESTVVVAKTGAISSVAERLLIANADSTLLGAEPLGFAHTNVSDEASDTLSLTETATVDVGALSAVEPEAGDILFAGDDAKDNEIYEIVLGVTRKRDTLSNAIIGAEKNFKYYVPLNKLATILKLPSAYNQQKRTLQGYALHPKNTFAIDLLNNSYSAKGETAALPEDGAFYYEGFDGDGDIYASLDVANLLWALDLDLDLSSLAIAVNTPKNLPYEVERARRKTQKKLAKKDTGIPSDLDLVETKSGYRWLGPHVLNVNNRTGYSEKNKFNNITTLTGSGDLLGATANYTVGIASNEQDRLDLQNARILLTRKGYGQNKTLPLGIKDFKVGDVVLNTNPTITNVMQGRGIYINTDDQRSYNSFGEITISGIAQPGWEVELYRFNQLIDFGFVDDTGQYIFQNVLLQVGENDFKIVLYGPQGQIQERFERYPVNANRLRPGETHLEAGIVDFNRPVFEVQDRAIDPTRQGNAGFIRLNRGINHNLSGFATLQTLPTVNGEKTYAGAGVEFNALGGVGQSQVLTDTKNNGTAFDTTFRRRFAGFNTTSRAAIYNNFESPTAGFGDNALTFDGRFRVDKNFTLPFADISLGTGAQYQKRQDGTTQTTLESTQAARFNRTLFSHNINTNYVNNEENITQGTLALRQDIGRNWSTRAGLRYNLFPETEADDFQYSLNYRGDNRLNGQFNVLKDLSGDDLTRIGLNGSYDFGSFLGGVTLNWDDQNGYAALLNLSTTLGPEDENSPYIATTSYNSFKTRLRVQLYEDIDRNGTFTEGDIPAQGIRVKVNGRKSLPSDKDGIVNLNNAGPPGEVAITLERETMPDPFLVGLKDGYSAILRPGVKPFINFPLYQSGSIDGSVRYANGSSANGIIVQLLDENGKLVQEVATLLDGFYVFEYVREGTYTVQVSPSHQVNVPPKTVKVTSDDLFAYGVDLILLEQAAEVVVTDDSVVRDGGRVAQLNHAPVAIGTLQPAPFSTDGLFDTAVKSVRIGEHPYKVRLVLDLSAPTIYEISSEQEGKIINIDLPKTAWDATRTWELDKHPLFEECGVYSINNGTGTRLRLTGREAVDIFYNAAIPSENKLPDRIYVDFLKK